MKYKLIIICFIALSCIIAHDIFSQVNDSKPVVNVSKKSTSEKIILEYTIPRPAFVEILVYGRNGEIFNIPRYSFLKTGNYQCEINKADLPVGSYTVELILDQDRRNSRGTGFNNQKEIKDYTFTNEENDLLNKGLSYSAQSPEMAKGIFDTLLIKHKRYLDRGTAFLYSLMTYMQLTDSAKVVSIIDSVEKYLPYSTSYLHISQISPYLKKYISIGTKYAQKAISHIDDVPLPYRNSYLYSYQCSLGDNYLAGGNDQKAIEAFLDALTTFNKLAAHDRWYKYNSDSRIYFSLATIADRNKSYLDALEYYKKAVIKESDNKEYWELLQRCFSLAFKSEIGYEDYKKQILSLIPSDEKTAIERNRFIGKRFPDLSVSTIDDKKVDLTEFKGKVTVINYWAYWCGTCLEERSLLENIFKEFKGNDFQVIGLHFQIGRFNNYKEELNLVNNVLLKHPTSFANYIRTSNRNAESSIGVDSVPTTLIVDKNGIIRFEEIGFDKNAFNERVRNNIKQLLEEK